MERSTQRSVRWSGLGGALLLLACFGGMGGANTNEQSAGNNDTGGIDLGGDDWSGGHYVEQEDGTTTWVPDFGDLAIDPSGQYLLTRIGSHLVHGDLMTGALSIVEGVTNPERLAFSNGGQRFFVANGAAVTAVDGRTLQALWKHPLGFVSWRDTFLYASPDGKRVAAVNDTLLYLLEETTGELVRTNDLGEIVDVDFAPDGARLYVVLEHTWEVRVPGQLSTPVTRLQVLAAGDGRVVTGLEIPNCSSLLALTPDGYRGFLAPTTCERPATAELPPTSHDPVSVIDLRELRFERNLPGFGPVDVATDGGRAVAFMDTWNLDVSLFDDPAQIPSSIEGRYRLMLIDTATLEFDSVALGASLPRYALTPDGQVVLVDVDWEYTFESSPVRVLDVATRTLDTVRGPEVQLDHYAMHPNSQDLFLLQSGDLYHLSIPQRRVERLETGRYLESLNLTPTGEHLLLLDEHGRLVIFDVADQSVEREMQASVDGTPLE